MPLFRASGVQHENTGCGCCAGDEREIELELECDTRGEFIDYLRSSYISYCVEADFYFEDDAIEVIDEEKRISSSFDIPDFSREPGFKEALVKEAARQKELFQKEKEEKERRVKEKVKFESGINKKENKANELFEYFQLRLKYDNISIPYEDPRLEWLGFGYRFDRLYQIAQEQNQNLTSFTISKKEVFRLKGFGSRIRQDQRFGEENTNNTLGYPNRLPDKNTPFARYSPDRKDINENYFGIPVYLDDSLDLNEIVVGYDEPIPPVAKGQYHSQSFSVKFH